MSVEQARLTGVVRLRLAGRGPKLGYVFDPHRLALPCWAEALPDRARPAVLVTLDRHLDLVPPKVSVPTGLSVAALEEKAQAELDVRNVDFILAGMEAGLVSNAIVVARAKPKGCLEGTRFVDSRGGTHELVVVPTVDALAQEFGTTRASPEARRASEWLAAAPATLLDVDLDCFTSPSDADPTTLVPWPESLIHDHVLPRGSEAFWGAVLGKCAALTFAREPYHCGGLVAGGRLFEAAARVVFTQLLGGDLP